MSIRAVVAWAARVAVLALAYYVTGRLGLLLAIPPGFATAVWPPSGLALAALLHFGTRLWPGVFLGSLLVNLATAYDPASPWSSCVLVLLVASGSVIQALAGATVVRRVVGFPNPLLQIGDIAAFMILGGPAACVISATVGVSSLWWIGRIAASEVAFNWFTWWVGDAIGVLTLTALLLVWVPSKVPLTRHRRWLVTAPVLLAATLVVLLFVYSSRREQARMTREFEQESAAATAALEHRLRYSVDALFALRTLYRFSDVVDHQEFIAASSDFLSRRPELQALSWNEGALDSDPLTEPVRRAALERACTSGELTASGAVPLAQSARRKGLLVVLPVPRNTPTPAAAPVAATVAATASASCHDRLLGAIVAVYRPDALIESALGERSFDRFRYQLFDASAPASELLYDSAATSDASAEVVGRVAQPSYSANVTLADRRLLLRIVPTVVFVNSQRSLQAWSILAGGLLFTSALTCILLIVTGRAAAALSLSESRDRALFDQSAAGIIELYPSGKILRANQRFCDIVGRTLAELQTLRLSNLTHPDDQHLDRRHFEQAFNGELPRAGWTKRYVRPDGSVVWVRVSGSVVRNSAGEPAYLVGVVQDITELVNAERAVAQSQSRLMSFVEHAPAAVAMFDRDLCYVAVSRRWLEDYKLGDRDVTGLHHYDVFPEIRNMPEWQAIHQRCLAGAVERSDEDHFVRGDGRDEWLQWEVRPWFDEYGEIGGIIMLTEVITARKQAAQALLESQVRLRLAVDNASLGLWEWDIAANTVTVDGNWSHIMGYDGDRLDDVAQLWQRSIHEEDWARVMELIDRYRRAEDGAFDIDYRATRKDGREIWLNSRGRVDRRDRTGQALHMIGTIQDVSERKRTEGLIRASLEEKEVLLREVHHRVKNNLAVISSLFYLQSTTTDHPDVIQMLEEGRSRIRSMALVHEQLYRSNRLAAVDFAEYTTSLAEQLLRGYRRPGAAIALETALTPVLMSVDIAIPCGLVLNELVTNCLKHAFNGAQHGVIEIALVHVSGSTHELRVSDDGVGTGDADMSGTHSLGLRLMRSLAKQLDGELVFEPRARGTCARLTFSI